MQRKIVTYSYRPSPMDMSQYIEIEVSGETQLELDSLLTHKKAALALEGIRNLQWLSTRDADGETP